MPDSVANRLVNATLSLAEDKITSKDELTTEFFRALILFLPKYVIGKTSSIVNQELTDIKITFQK